MLYLIQNDVGKDKIKNGVSRSGANWVFGGARVDENARVDEKWGYFVLEWSLKNFKEIKWSYKAFKLTSFPSI